ncbi:IclR family transcriptional regulator [Pseudonocardia sp. N23]|uniref:IclR family transcriptional regulator n=1 Tax=Pseudonocardia sp. N23 TaxID=1987376 RepID=UPI000BFB4B30|nr:IclR family transcriptional regulator [Pseudonocardia sp. N23]GAY11501.1 transcriptional regulator, IclR family [Pseudonocardia sp. N23]
MDSRRLGRIFDIVDHLAAHGPGTVSELSARLDLPLSSTHDLLRAMVEAKTLHLSGRRYGLGPRAIRTAIGVLDSVAVRRIAAPHLDVLADRTGFDTYLAVATGSRIVYVSRHAGRQHVNLDIPLGRSLHLHSTAVGKLFAAYRPEVADAMLRKPRPALTPQTRTSPAELDRDLAGIRSRGVSISRGESIRGVVGLATAVRDPGGTVVAAVHVSALRTTLPARRLGEVTDAMHATSTAIEAELADPAGAATADAG